MKVEQCLSTDTAMPFWLLFLTSIVGSCLSLMAFGPPSLVAKVPGQPRSAATIAKEACSQSLKLAFLAVDLYGFVSQIMEVVGVFGLDMDPWSKVMCSSVLISRGGLKSFLKAFGLYVLYTNRDGFVSVHRLAAGQISVQEFQASNAAFAFGRIIAQIRSSQGLIAAVFIGSMLPCYLPYYLFAMLVHLMPAIVIFLCCPLVAMLMVNAMSRLVANLILYKIRSRAPAAEAELSSAQLVPETSDAEGGGGEAVVKKISIHQLQMDPTLRFAVTGFVQSVYPPAVAAFDESVWSGEKATIYEHYEQILECATVTGAPTHAWVHFANATIFFPTVVPILVDTTARLYLGYGWVGAITATFNERHLSTWLHHVGVLSKRAVAALALKALL